MLRLTNSAWISELKALIWGWPLIVLILATGACLSASSRLVQVRHLGEALRCIFRKEKNGEGDVSNFGALCTALSATIGTGNIIGVAMAVSVGGPGALFWMLAAAFLGMATKYAEGLLALKYRVKQNGHFLGGPFYYIENGMGKRWRPLAKCFAFFGVCAGIMGIGTITQVNGITFAVGQWLDSKGTHTPLCLFGHNYSPVTIITGALVTLLAGLVIIGGVKRIAGFSEIVIPFATFIYVFFSFVILIRYFDRIPSAVVLILKGAFSPQAVLGGMTGTASRYTLQSAVKIGVGRGIFSNEAGLGSAPIAAAAAHTKQPVRQGLVSMTATFFDTIIICTMTGLCIVLTGAWRPELGLEGVSITSYAWTVGLPWHNEVLSEGLLALCLIFFAFTTILGWNYYCEKCLEYLSNGNMRVVKAFRWLYICAVFVGPYLSVSAVWAIADIFNGLMALPNLTALVALRGVVRTETQIYFKQRRNVVF